MSEPIKWVACTQSSDRAYWGEFYLEAWTDGRWRVSPWRTPSIPLVDHTQQGLGTNISEAKQRAQAAALIQQQLARMTKP